MVPFFLGFTKDHSIGGMLSFSSPELFFRVDIWFKKREGERDVGIVDWRMVEELRLRSLQKLRSYFRLGWISQYGYITGLCMHEQLLGH